MENVTWKISTQNREFIYRESVHKKKKKSNVKRVAKTLTSVVFGYWNYE